MGNRIKIYKSLEEQKQDEYRYAASLTGIQNLLNAKALIERVYSKQIADNKSKPRNNRITIIRNG